MLGEEGTRVTPKPLTELGCIAGGVSCVSDETCTCIICTSAALAWPWAAYGPAAGAAGGIPAVGADAGAFDIGDVLATAAP